MCIPLLKGLLKFNFLFRTLLWILLCDLVFANQLKIYGSLQAHPTGTRWPSPSCSSRKRESCTWWRRNGGEVTDAQRRTAKRPVPWVWRTLEASSSCWPLVSCCLCSWPSESSSTCRAKTAILKRWVGRRVERPRGVWVLQELITPPLSQPKWAEILQQLTGQEPVVVLKHMLFIMSVFYFYIYETILVSLLVLHGIHTKKYIFFTFTAVQYHALSHFITWSGWQSVAFSIVWQFKQCDVKCQI